MNNTYFNKVDYVVFLKLNCCSDRDCGADWDTGSFELVVLYYCEPGNDSALTSLFSRSVLLLNCHSCSPQGHHLAFAGTKPSFMY